MLLFHRKVCARGIGGVGYLISFSTEIETLDISDFKTGNALEKLVQFLRMSFHGGMDATPALHLSLKVLIKIAQT